MMSTAVLASCADNMNYHEYANYGKDYIDDSYEHVIGLVTNIYSMLDYDFGQVYSGGMLASACDEAEYAYANGAVCDFTNGSWSPANPLSNTWTQSYRAIQACNQYLHEFQGLTFDELKLNDDYQAQMFRYTNSFHEVRFLRAYFYFNLARQYGDVPYFTELMTTDKVNTLKRTPVQEVFKAIQEECDAVIDKLPADYTDLGLLGLTPAENGRVTKYAAMALKARVALYAASPLFNVANDKTLWQSAAQANKELIDACMANKFALGKYADLWGPNNWANKEMIFMRRYYTTSTGVDSNILESYNYPIGITGGQAGNCPTQNLVDAYEMKATGKLWNEEGSGYNPDKPYEGRDPRFNMTIVKNGDTKWPAYNTTPIQTYYGGINGEPISGATPTGYYLRKYLDPSVDMRASSKIRMTRHTWITFRLGEFYLNYAEAVFRFFGSADATSSDFPMSAIEAVNTIRNRTDVMMPAFPAGLSATEFETRYRNERMVELAFEGHRFYDLRRWKQGEKLKSITEMKLTLNSDGSITYTRNVVNRTWDDKMYLFPIPQSERMKNKNLVQNPGW